MNRILTIGVAAFVAVIGGFFSLGLWSAGIKYGTYWQEGAFLGLVLFALSIGIAAIVFLLGTLVDRSGQ